MGFFYEEAAGSQQKRGPQRVIPVELMKEQGCNACSLNVVDDERKHPKMKPGGPEKAQVYVLDGYPNESDDKHDELLTGPEGKLFYRTVDDNLDLKTRIGYTVRCRPVGSSKVGVAEITCCSKHLDSDIEQSQPLVVIGMGAVALQWALGFAGQDRLWRGRVWPIKVGAHVCWYYHVSHAEFVLSRQEDKKYDSEWLVAYRHDLEQAFKFAKRAVRQPPPRWYDHGDRIAGIHIVEGHGELDYESIAFDLELLAGKPITGLDIETTALRPYNKHSLILTVSISCGDFTTAFPIDHPRGWPTEGLRKAVKRLVLQFILDSGPKVAHNLSFELEWLCYEFDESLARKTEWEDSMAAAHVCDQRTGGRSGDRGGVLSLGMVTVQQFGFDVKAMSNLDTKRLLEYPLADVLLYNALDAKWCLLAFLNIRKNVLKGDEVLEAKYNRKVELAPTLVRSQLRGLHCDFDYAEEWRVKLEEEMEGAARLLAKANEVKKFEAHFGRPFNPGSDDDVVGLVRDIMRRAEGQQDGRYSADESVLSSIPEEAGIAPAQVLIHRGASKLHSTYILPLLSEDPAKSIIYPDGLIHTNYNSMVAETDRLSSDDPNNQNWPKRKRKEIRGVIVSPDNHWIVAADYGAGEARTCAMLSEDVNLVKALWSDFDIHKHWATRFVEVYPEIKDSIVREFDIDWDEKGPKTLRQEAKNKWVFPMFFGASHRSCARNLHMPDEVADELKKEFWDEYFGVKKWQERTVAFWQKHLYVETLGGHRRHGPLSLNQIINTPVQGTLAEIVTDAMTRVSVQSEVEDKPWLQPPLNVHDDLTFYVPDLELEDAVEDIAHTMCACTFPFINVPLLVEVSVSKKRWSDLKEIGTFRSDVLGYHRRKE